MNQELEKTSVLTFDPTLAVKKFDSVASGLASMKERYSGLVINGVEDKDGYEVVKVALRDCVSTRTKIEPIKIGLTEEARTFVTAVNAEAKRIVAALKEIEDPLSAEKSRIDALVAQAKQDKIDAELNEYNRRINLCLGSGMTYTVQEHEGKNRDVYVIGAICVTPTQIKLSDSEKFDRFILAVKKENEAITLKKKEEEDAAKAEKLRLKEEQEALKKEQDELLEAQKAQQSKESELIEKAKEIEVQGKAIEIARAEITKIWSAPEPIRSPEEAIEENTYAHGIPDEGRLRQFATYLEFNMQEMVPNCTEEWAIPIADKMREQFFKMATYIRDRCPSKNV